MTPSSTLVSPKIISFKKSAFTRAALVVPGKTLYIKKFKESYESFISVTLEFSKLLPVVIRPCLFHLRFGVTKLMERKDLS